MSLTLRLTETCIDDDGLPLRPSTVVTWPNAGGWPSRKAWMDHCREQVGRVHYRDTRILLPHGIRETWPGVVTRDVELVEG